MPAGDQTGPLGYGPLTGRGLGPCGRGLRRGYGYRRFWRAPVNQPIELSKEEQKKIVESEIKDIEQELVAFKEELKRLK